MTLEDALGHKPETLHDYVMAYVLFPIVKHRSEEKDQHDLDNEAEEEINNMSNVELLSYISLAMEEMLKINEHRNDKEITR